MDQDHRRQNVTPSERLARSLPALDMRSAPPLLPKLKKKKHWRERRNEALTCIISALYAKILVILGIALPITDSIAYEDYESYDGFYIYLYIGSVGFLLYTYVYHVKGKSKQDLWKNSFRWMRYMNDDILEEFYIFQLRDRYLKCGSFYFKVGVMGFGIGSVIYTALQFGQYFELSTSNNCNSILRALKPILRTTFSFMQMLFIFSYNNIIEAKQSKLIAKFGVMHMIATNLCDWLYVLTQETKYDIFRSAQRRQLNALRDNISLSELDRQFISSKSFQITKQLYDYNYECLNSKIMDSILRKVEPYLAPCCVEFSFLCAVILGLMWKNTCDNENRNESSLDNQMEIKEKQSECNLIYSRRQSQFSVDCAQAHKGLFSGILVLAMTIISLIMFFELVSYKNYKDIAILQVNVWEATLFVTGTLAAIFCIVILRDAGFRTIKHELELEHLLLLVTQSGVFMYYLFQVIGAALMGLNKGKGGVVRIITPLCAVAQSCCQTVLILNVWKKKCVTPDEIRRKPGRQLVTFLLVINIALWIVNRLKNNQAFSHPNQMDFYGVLAWNIITHVSMPMVVSYRFQATVCFYEIYKYVYKTPAAAKPTFTDRQVNHV